MTEVSINDIPAFKLPAEWNELTAEQLLALADSLPALYAKPTIEAEVYQQTKIILMLAGAPLIADGVTDYLNEEVRTKLLPLLEFLKVNRLSKQLLPIIKFRRGFRLYRFHGPYENFTNLTFGEFEDCEYFLEILQGDYHDEMKEDALHKLCAILYRTYGARKGDDRVEYNAYDNIKNAELFTKCPANYKMCIVLFYLGCRASLVSDFAMLFDGKGGDSGHTWADFAHNLAGPVLGTIDEVNARMVRQVFFEMRRIKMQAEEIEERNKQQAQQ